tara:strand:- start:18406 stop:18915 length:510 start_codon:yes stop_codon:yes gene_type:complete
MSRSFVEVPLLKLKYVNNIKHLPTDVIEIIKSFCFITRKEAELIFRSQYLKTVSSQLIKGAFCSRKCSIDELAIGFGEWAYAHPQFTETADDWFFGFSPIQDVNYNRWDWTLSINHLNQQYLELQGDNCKKCGEYKYVSFHTFPETPSKIKLCNCPENYNYYPPSVLNN